MTKKKTQLPSQTVKCDLCGKSVFARGLKSHLRLAHKVKMTQVTAQTSPAMTQVTTDANSLIFKSPESMTQVIETIRTYTPIPSSHKCYCHTCGEVIDYGGVHYKANGGGIKANQIFRYDMCRLCHSSHQAKIKQLTQVK